MRWKNVAVKILAQRSRFAVQWSANRTYQIIRRCTPTPPFDYSTILVNYQVALCIGSCTFRDSDGRCSVWPKDYLYVVYQTLKRFPVFNPLLQCRLGTTGIPVGGLAKRSTTRSAFMQ